MGLVIAPPPTVYHGRLTSHTEGSVHVWVGILHHITAMAVATEPVFGPTCDGWSERHDGSGTEWHATPTTDPPWPSSFRGSLAQTIQTPCPIDRWGSIIAPPNLGVCVGPLNPRTPLIVGPVLRGSIPVLLRSDRRARQSPSYRLSESQHVSTIFCTAQTRPWTESFGGVRGRTNP